MILCVNIQILKGFCYLITEIKKKSNVSIEKIIQNRREVATKIKKGVVEEKILIVLREQARIALSKMPLG